MSDLELFIDGRVAETRQMLEIDIPLESDKLPPAISLGCSETGITVVILPTTAPGVLHLQVHTFVDGESQQPEVDQDWSATGACAVELVLRRTVPMT